MLLRTIAFCLLLVTTCIHSSTTRAGTVGVDLSTTLALVGPAPVAAGSEFQLRWEISNNSDNVSSQALGTLEIDSRAEFVEASCPSTPGVGTLTWTPPSVDNAAPRQCLVTLRTETTPPATLAFLASVATSPQDTDTDTSNNSDIEEVDIALGAAAVTELDAGSFPTMLGLILALFLVAQARLRRVVSRSGDA